VTEFYHAKESCTKLDDVVKLASKALKRPEMEEFNHVLALISNLWDSPELRRTVEGGERAELTRMTAANQIMSESLAHAERQFELLRERSRLAIEELIKERDTFRDQYLQACLLGSRVGGMGESVVDTAEMTHSQSISLGASVLASSAGFNAYL